MKYVDMLRAWIEMCSGYLGPNPLLQSAIVMAITIIIAYLMTSIICRFIGRLTKFSKTDVDDELIRMLRRPMFVTIVLIGASLAVGRLDMAERSAMISQSLLKSIGVWLWMMFALSFTRLILNALKNMRRGFDFIDNRTLPLIQNVMYLFILVAAVYAFMNAWNKDVTALLASAGILGLALSFAAKDTLANVFAGVSILIDNPYKVGDFVVLGTGERGEVTQIGIRSTRLLTRDDVEITIPNAVIGNAQIINETGGPHEKYRVRNKISVSYSSDLQKVCDVLQEIAVNQTGVCDTPVPRVRVREFGDSGINIELLSWVPTPVDRGRITHELNLKIFRIFKEKDIEIPFPQQEVLVKNLSTDNT
ncbi:MAG: mechanosensitive ion channel family protein [Gammaproteobacteria bacterium]